MAVLGRQPIVMFASNVGANFALTSALFFGSQECCNILRGRAPLEVQDSILAGGWTGALLSRAYYGPHALMVGAAGFAAVGGAGFLAQEYFEAFREAEAARILSERRQQAGLLGQKTGGGAGAPTPGAVTASGLGSKGLSSDDAAGQSQRIARQYGAVPSGGGGGGGGGPAGAATDAGIAGKVAESIPSWFPLKIEMKDPAAAAVAAADEDGGEGDTNRRRSGGGGRGREAREGGGP